MRQLFDQIPLEQSNTSMTINAPAAWLLAMYVALGDEQGADRKLLQGTTQNDLIKEYLSRGTYIFPPEPSLRLIGDMIAWCYREVPKWNPMNVCSYHLQEAGATPEQELAFALATAISVLDTVRPAARCPRKTSRSSPRGSASSSTPACGSSPSCARCGRSPGCGTRSCWSATACRTRRPGASAMACRSTAWA
jgi:hypothetical protein